MLTAVHAKRHPPIEGGDVGLRNWDWSGDAERPDWQRLLVGLRDGAFLGVERGVRKRGMVSVHVGWLARGGLLRLRDDGVEFTPSPLDRLLGARPRSMPFSGIDSLERLPARQGEFLPGGLRPRLRFHLIDGARIDIVPPGIELDVWFEAIRTQRILWGRRQIEPTDPIAPGSHD